MQNNQIGCFKIKARSNNLSSLFFVVTILSLISGCYAIPIVTSNESIEDISVLASTETELVVTLPISKSLRDKIDVLLDKTILVGPKTKEYALDVQQSSIQPVDQETSFDIILLEDHLKPGKYTLEIFLLGLDSPKQYKVDFMINRKYITFINYIGVHD